MLNCPPRQLGAGSPYAKSKTRSHAEYFWLIAHFFIMGQMLYPPKSLLACLFETLLVRVVKLTY